MARQEYLNEAVSQNEGSYYTREVDLLVGEGRDKCHWDGEEKVYTFWDLGGDKADSDTTAITFATYNRISKRVGIIDYYENRGHLRGHYLDYISSKPYRYGGHFIPHDGKRSNTFTGEGFAETSRRIWGVDVRYVPIAQNTMNEIEVARRGFANTWINLPRCQKLFEHLSKYHENQSTQKPCHRNSCSICHGASHGADSFRLLHMAIEHGIVEDYLDEGQKIHLPDRIEDDWVIV